MMSDVPEEIRDLLWRNKVPDAIGSRLLNHVAHDLEVVEAFKRGQKSAHNRETADSIEHRESHPKIEVKQ
jgi:hypothetical protein